MSKRNRIKSYRSPKAFEHFVPHREPNRIPRSPLQGAEIEVSEWLDDLGHLHEGEPHRFFIRLASGRITCMAPDFYLPGLKLYIEVTEVRREGLKQAKIGRIAETMPKWPIILIGSAQLRELRQDPGRLQDYIDAAVQNRYLTFHGRFAASTAA
ncbi:hypothetical protein HJC99_04930 [Candidatus Saccharibacteria bacterium]|nr:hypothetical protein [Candidatus Saccharibacteria bacterium]